MQTIDIRIPRFDRYKTLTLNLTLGALALGVMLMHALGIAQTTDFQWGACMAVCGMAGMNVLLRLVTCEPIFEPLWRRRLREADKVCVDFGTQIRDAGDGLKRMVETMCTSEMARANEVRLNEYIEAVADLPPDWDTPYYMADGYAQMERNARLAKVCEEAEAEQQEIDAHVEMLREKLGRAHEHDVVIVGHTHDEVLAESDKEDAFSRWLNLPKDVDDKADSK